MPLPALLASTVFIAALVAIAVEAATARRRFRPPRPAVLAAAAAVALVALTVAALHGFSMSGVLGMPRRYAAYGPEEPVGPVLLVPLLGVGLLLGAFVAAVRAAARPDREVVRFSRSANLLLAGAGMLLGLLLVVAGVLGIVLR